MLPDSDVLIVGGGPTGLLLAGDLAAAGVSCTLLERRDGESNLTRAFGVHARTLELLDARGLARDLIATGVRVSGLGSFGLGFFRLPSRFPYLLITPQYETERILGTRARALGAEIAGGAEVVALRQDLEGVDLTVRDAGGGTYTRRARYVVGTDGVHSVVRRELGLPFPGRSAVRSVVICDVRLLHPPVDTVTARATGEGVVFTVPFGDGWHRVIAWNRRGQPPESAPVSLDEVRDIVRRVLGTDLGMHDPRWISRFHSDERQVPRYRDGRVFLAGDAAHVHSPAGGMGMNTGLQDAVNLGWKLTAAVKGWAPDGLLDTYHDERYPVGRRVLRTSGVILRGALLGPGALRFVRDALLAAASRSRWIARRMAGAVSGIDLAYAAPPGAHPLTGRRAPDIPLAGGTPRTLYRALRPGRFLLVVPPGADVDTARPGGWADRVDLAVAGGATRTVVLVRPDGYIAWADDDADPAGRAAAIRTALSAWCGPSADRVAH
ncbi:FAD-dependent monooxygenase [Actinomadura sp. DC4]|uniref:FAD-dependent monooxygenase n=1 Tax=Actinomadura sp. DC4 TaxID=3055069 RepID=UPI0025AEF8B7|nr:FAD-dependent monooxygenase [Actinomadura sp. DC4]MDN3358276.1 FAD-dependent monooxygenase [Actinomadura sp. DC4]